MSPPPAPRAAPLEVTSGWYGRACDGHAASGDPAIVVEAVVEGSPSIRRAILIDVAGHGPEAAAVTEHVRGAPWLATSADPAEVAIRLNYDATCIVF
jgi:hypothetical protein